MDHTEEFALYLMAVLGVAALLTSDDSTAWLGLLVLIAGLVLGAVLELAVWWQDRQETRHDERKKKREGK